jgi:hypothetical protein
MRCYACDKILPDGAGLDGKTGRFYCEPCLEATYDVILKEELKDSEYWSGIQGLVSLDDIQEDLDFKEGRYFSYDE